MADAPTGFYASLEEKYYGFLDALDSKGIPVYSVVDAVEGANIPSFPIAILLALIVLGLIIYGLGSTFFGAVNLNVSVQDVDGVGIAGASVNVSVDGADFDSKKTGNDGKTTVKVPSGKEAKIGATKRGFGGVMKAYTAKAADEALGITLEEETSTVKKTINLLAAGTSRAFTKDVEVEFSCTGNTNFSKRATSSAGKIEVEVPSDCDTLKARPLGGFSVQKDTVFLSSDTRYEISLSEKEGGAGNVVVTVRSSTGEVVSGVDVSLYTVTEDNRPGTSVDSKPTSNAGTVPFNGVQAGRYYVVAYDRSGNYSEFDGLKENLVQEVKADSTVEFAVVLKQSVAGKVKLVVKDKSTREEISGALVKLSKGQTDLRTETTSQEGKAEFNVGEDIEYNVLVDKAGYLLHNTKARPSQDTREVLVEAATIENSQSLFASIVDENDRPIENVRAKLKNNADGAQVGAELVSGLDGRITFERVQEGVYYVYAVKPGYGEKQSEPISVSNRKQNALTIRLPLGSGRIEAYVVDADGKPVTNASIKVVDFGPLQTLQEASADSDGKKVFSVRADKKVFLIVNAEGLATFTTVPTPLQRDATVQKRIVMQKPVSGFGVELEGLSAGEETVSEAGAALTPGQKYTARLRLMVPKTSGFEEAGAYIRAGEEENNSVEKDSIYITEVRAAATRIVQGNTYTPKTGQTNDLQHITTGNAKWSLATFKSIAPGVYEIEADVQVRQEAKIGAALDVAYRAYGKSGGYLREPNDAELGTAESVSAKQGLYANTRKRTFTAGPSTLCSEDFCSKYEVEDLREKITSSIIESYIGQIGNRYRLLFEVSSTSRAGFGQAQLSVKDRTSSIAVESYNVKTAAGQERTGQGVGSEVSVDVGELSRDAVVGGEVVFTAKKEGTVPIEVTIKSGSGAGSQSVVYQKTIYVKVMPAATLRVDVLPKVIVPFVNNNILVRVTDDNGQKVISNATVSIKKEGTTVATGETDIDGVFAYTLLSPSEGSLVGVAVEKSGFRPVERELKVTPNILTTEPLILRLSMAVGGKDFKSIDARINNHSQIPLEIEKVGFSREFEGFAEFSIDSPKEGDLIAPDSNTTLSGTLKLGTRGSEVERPTKLQGTINVQVTNQNFRQKWLATIPMELTIGFGEEVDDTACFTINPGEWKIFGSTNETRKLEVGISNNCTVGGEKVRLSKLSARIVSGSDNLFGKLRATSSLEGSRQVELDKAFKVIAQNVPESAEEKIALEFKPDNVVSGKSEGRIEVQASHLTSKGEQKLVQKITLSIGVNNLAQCVEVLTDRDLVVNSCPYNTGFGLYGNRFSQFQNSRYGAFDPYSSRYGYGQGLPPNLTPAVPPYTPLTNPSIGPGTTQLPGAANRAPLGANYYDYRNPANYGLGGIPGYGNSYQNSYYPNTYYNQPFYGSDSFSQPYDLSWNCGPTQFQVRNNCSTAVELSFDSQPGIIVSNKATRVEAGKTEDITVEPTNFFGRYALDVKAKPSESNERATTVKKVFVNVTNELAKNYKDCIAIDPAGTISFNNFIGRPATLKVKNYCLNQGVFLRDDPSTLAFALSSGLSPTAQDLSQFGGLIQSIQSFGENIETTSDGRATQVITFEIVKNVSEYRNRAPPPKFFDQNPFASIGNLRYFVTQGYYSVQAKGVLFVRFMTPSGMQRTTNFPITLQDFWPLLESAEQIGRKFTTYGDPSVSPENCLNLNALNFSSIEVPVNVKLRTMENGGLFKITSGEQRGVCGTVDKLELLEPGDFRAGSGLVMHVRPDPTDPDHELEVTFDDSQGWSGQATSFTSQGMTGKVIRASPPNARLVKLSMSARVKAGQPTRPGQQPVQPGQQTGTPGQPGVPGQPVQVQECKITKPDGSEDRGQTGDAAYYTLGFQHFQYKWNTNKDAKDFVPKNACDALQADGATTRALSATGSEPWFCDALQTTIALSQKAEEVKAVAGAVKAVNNGLGNCTEAAGFKCSENENKNSTNLFRYAVSQEQTKGYFLGSDGGLIDITDEVKLSDKISGATKSLISALKGREANPSTFDSIIAGTGEAISNVLSKPDDMKLPAGASIVLDLKDWKAQSTAGTDWKNPQETGGKFFGGNWYAMPLDKYLEFHRGIVQQCKTTEKECELTIAGQKKKLTLKFLEQLAKGKWKVTAKNATDMAQLVKEAVMKKGKWGIGNEASDEVKKYRNNLFLFHKANVESDIYLLSDSYAKEFNDALGNSSEYASLKDKLEYEAGDKVNLGSVEAGLYNVVLNYNWGTGTETVNAKLSAAKKLEEVGKEYPKNPLFQLPADGKSGSLKWGTGFGNNAGALYLQYSETEPGASVQAKNAIEARTGVVFTYNTNYETTRTGRIASISKGAFEYSPSDPVKLNITMNKAKPDTPAGAVFDFIASGTKKLTGVQYTVKQDDLAGATLGSTVTLGQIEGSNICKTGAVQLNRQYEGIKYDTGIGTAQLQGLLFVPSRTANTSSSINIACVKDSGNFTAQYIMNGGVTSAQYSSGTLDLTPDTSKNNPKVIYNLRNLAEMLKDNQQKRTCVKTEGIGIGIYWNEAAFRG